MAKVIIAASEGDACVVLDNYQVIIPRCVVHGTAAGGYTLLDLARNRERWMRGTDDHLQYLAALRVGDMFDDGKFEWLTEWRTR